MTGPSVVDVIRAAEGSNDGLNAFVSLADPEDVAAAAAAAAASAAALAKGADRAAAQAAAAASQRHLASGEGEAVTRREMQREVEAYGPLVTSLLEGVLQFTPEEVRCLP